jgi:hypothetical protein
LRYELGNRICQVLGMSQRWLAEGKGSEWTHVTIEAPLRQLIPPNLLFSKAYLNFLKPLLDAHFEEVGHAYEHAKTREGVREMDEVVLPSIGNVSAEVALSYSASRLKNIYEDLPPQLMQGLHSAVAKAADTYRMKHRGEITSYLALRVKGEEKKTNKVLPTFPLKGKRLFMKLTLPGLRSRLKRATAHHGAKSSLARELGVKPARITEWLNAEKEPGGAFTLAMLNWVEAWEAEQNKNRSDACNTATAKTRKRNLYEKKSQSGPPK